MNKIFENIKNFFGKIGTTFSTQVKNIHDSGKSLVFTFIFTFLLMFVVCLVVFFANVQGAEKVMVPNVTGENLTTALLEMQAKELYPKIQLKYSDEPGDEGKVLAQDPDPGAIVKAYRRVTLTVSRGIAMDNLFDYTGKTIDDVRKSLDALFTAQRPLVTLKTPVYVQDSSAEGTILAQFPSAGTPIVDPVEVQFVVSAGNETLLVDVQSLKGKTIADALKIMSSSEVVYDFTYRDVQNKETAGTIVEEAEHEAKAEPFTRISEVIALAPRAADSSAITGIYTYELPEYPYAVPVTLEARDSDGKVTTIVSFNHPGLTLTIPYEVTKGTVLRLSVMGEVVDESTIM